MAKRRRTGKVSIWRIILCVVFPPLAVVDKGLNAFLIVALLTVFAWVPGIVGAFIITYKNKI